MHRITRDRFNAWQDLDALVGAELDALQRRRPEPAEYAPEEDAPADAFEESFAEGEFTDEPFGEDADDEEAFIERTAAWLRERPDADALLDAIRAALDEVAEAPAEPPSPDIAPADEPPPPESDGEG